jgi:hypothetical protein
MWQCLLSPEKLAFEHCTGITAPDPVIVYMFRIRPRLPDKGARYVADKVAAKYEQAACLVCAALHKPLCALEYGALSLPSG